MFGISVYLSDIDETYIKKAAECGAKYIFTSLHIPEEDLSELDKNLPYFLQLAKQHNLSIIPDISPYTFEKLGLENNDFEGLKALGFNLVRLDFGFEDVNTVMEITKYFDVVLNASLVNAAYLKQLDEVGFDFNAIYLMHNFYPLQDTGLNDSYFESLNDVHKQYPVKRMAFVAGDKKRRLPLYEGLPTLERHRYTNPYVAAIEMYIKHDIQVILIGDNQAKYSTLEFIHEYINNNILTVPAHFENDYESMYNQVFDIRQDDAESLIRLKTPRVKDIDIISNSMRKQGNIIMMNALAGRYSGEVQIVTKDMPYTSRTNNIGWIHPEFIELLQYINYETKVRFIKIERVN